MSHNLTGLRESHGGFSSDEPINIQDSDKVYRDINYISSQILSETLVGTLVYLVLYTNFILRKLL